DKKQILDDRNLNFECQRCGHSDSDSSYLSGSTAKAGNGHLTGGSSTASTASTSTPARGESSAGACGINGGPATSPQQNSKSNQNGERPGTPASGCDRWC